MTLARLMVAFDGAQLPRSAARRINEQGVAGVTLFHFYNVVDPPQIRRLTAAIQAARPAGAPPVLVAARDLSPGVLRPGDLRTVPMPDPPDGALRTGATGRVLAAPMRRGEPLTDARLLDQLRLPPQLEQHHQADQAQDQQPRPRQSYGHPPARHRPAGGARHAGIEVCIDDIVVHAPRPAHRDAAEQQPQHQADLPPRPRQPHPPGTGPEQQPPADRPVESGQHLQIARALRQARH